MPKCVLCNLEADRMVKPEEIGIEADVEKIPVCYYHDPKEREEVRKLIKDLKKWAEEERGTFKGR